MSVSKLARSIHESATLKLNEKAAQLRERGEPVIHGQLINLPSRCVGLDSA